MKEKTMTDKDFLIWLHQRLVNIHNENELYDYMHKLRQIIFNMPNNYITPNTCDKPSYINKDKIIKTELEIVQLAKKEI